MSKSEKKSMILSKKNKVVFNLELQDSSLDSELIQKLLKIISTHKLPNTMRNALK